MKHIRSSKNKKNFRRLKVKQPIVIDRAEMDKIVFDVVLKTLYNNADKDILNLETEIYAPANIKLPHKESERLWEVMTSSGFVSPVVGFGNSGKVELTRNGYQLMAQYGGYSEYLASVQNSAQQPQTIILPIQVQEADEPAQPDIPQLQEPDKKSARRARRNIK